MDKAIGKDSIYQILEATLNKIDKLDKTVDDESKKMTTLRIELGALCARLKYLEERFESFTDPDYEEEEEEDEESQPEDSMSEGLSYSPPRTRSMRKDNIEKTKIKRPSPYTPPRPINPVNKRCY